MAGSLKKRYVVTIPGTGPINLYQYPCATCPNDPTDPLDMYKLSTTPLKLCDIVNVDLASKQTTPYSWCSALTAGDLHVQDSACWVWATTKGIEASERSGWIMVSTGSFLDGMCSPDPEHPPSEGRLAPVPSSDCQPSGVFFATLLAIGTKFNACSSRQRISNIVWITVTTRSTINNA